MYAGRLPVKPEESISRRCAEVGSGRVARVPPIRRTVPIGPLGG